MSADQSRLLEPTLEAIDRLFGDRSVSPETTLDHLETVREHVADLIAAINQDLKQEEGG